jgi:hypothetical protein
VSISETPASNRQIIASPIFNDDISFADLNTPSLGLVWSGHNDLELKFQTRRTLLPESLLVVEYPIKQCQFEQFERTALAIQKRRLNMKHRRTPDYL